MLNEFVAFVATLRCARSGLHNFYIAYPNATISLKVWNWCQFVIYNVFLLHQIRGSLFSISLFLFHIQFLHHTQIKQKLWKLRLKITARNLFAKMQNKRFNVSSLIGAFSAFDLICMKTSWIANKTRNGKRNSDEMKEKTGVKTVNEMRKLKYYDNVIILEAAVWLNVIFFFIFLLNKLNTLCIKIQHNVLHLPHTNIIFKRRKKLFFFFYINKFVVSKICGWENWMKSRGFMR